MHACKHLLCMLIWTLARSTLQQLPVHQRAQAAEAMSAEAYWRVQDPVYGSVGVINLLQQHIYMNQRELARTRAHIAIHSPTRGPCSPWAGLWTSPIWSFPTTGQFCPPHNFNFSRIQPSAGHFLRNIYILLICFIKLFWMIETLNW